MPHISTKGISNNTSKKIYSQFVKTINKSGDKSFVGEFFTETEKIMFAKRLAVILMLNQDFSYLTIQKMLGVSSSTINRIAKTIDRGGFRFSKKIVEDKKLKDRAWSDLEKILRAGLPPMGKGRWKFLDDIG